MQDQPRRAFAAAQPHTRDELPPFVPSIDTREVFRQLIVDEIRNGRLTPARRRRVVRYAAGLGLSAVQAGRLVARCREEVLRTGDPTERRHALRLADPATPRFLTPARMVLMAACLLLVALVLINWPW
jgi:hypothetical protein